MAPLNIQEVIYPHLNRIHMILGGQPFLLKNEQIQTDTRTVSIRIVSMSWNNRDPTIRNLPNISQFKNALQQLIRPKKRHLFGINDRVGVNLLTRLRVDFSDLKLHKFSHRFNCDSPLCSCGQSFEPTVHFFLHCQLYTDLRRVLLDSISEIILNDV